MREPYSNHRKAELFIGMMLGAIISIIAVLTAVHGVLRPALENRGVAPWSVRDTMGSAPTAWAGSGCLGAGAIMIVSGIEVANWWTIAEGAGVAAIGWVVLVIGVMELRKLH